MSSKVFKTKLGDGSTRRSVSYKRGATGQNLPLVDELIECFTDKKNPNHYRQEHYYRQINEAEFPEDFEPNLFLEGLVVRLTTAMKGEHLEHLEYLFNPVLQGLYKQGYNGFNLDFSQFPSLLWMGGSLKGGPDTFFDLTYSGEVHTFASKVDRCRIKYSGKAVFFGLGATWSYLSTDAEIICPASKAEDSVFHFLKATPMLWTSRGASMRNANLEQPERCGFFLEEGAEDVEMDCLIKEGFFERENTVWVPDAKGGWKEVPE